MDQPKLTPTYNDQAKLLKANHITAAHEPIAENAGSWATAGAISGPAGPLPQPQADQPLKIALIGTAPSSRLMAPYDDPSWTIWACSPGNMGVCKRVDAWFEVHGSLLWPENRHYGEPYIKWLNEQNFPVFMHDNSLVPRATALPKDELVQEFGPYFFTSSFAWMLGMAMLKGAKEIAMYGIDMASRDEYIIQRPGAYYFFMEGRRRGCKVTAPYESDIMQPPGLYGFSEVTQYGRKVLARKVELEARVRDLRAQRDGAAQQVTYLEGALEDLDYFHSIFGGVQNNSLIEAKGT